MKIVFESSTAIVTYLDNGHLLHTDRTSGALYRTRGTWVSTLRSAAGTIY